MGPEDDPADEITIEEYYRGMEAARQAEENAEILNTWPAADFANLRGLEDELDWRENHPGEYP